MLEQFQNVHNHFHLKENLLTAIVRYAMMFKKQHYVYITTI